MKEALAVSVFCALSLVTAAPSVAEPVQLGGRYLDFITAAGGDIAGVVGKTTKKEEGQGRENRWTTRGSSQDLLNLGIYNDILLTVDDANVNAFSNLSNAPASLSIDTGTVASAPASALAVNKNGSGAISAYRTSSSKSTTGTGTVASATASALAVNENGSGATSAYRTSSSKSIKTSEEGQATASSASMSMSSNSSLSTATNAAIRFTPAALSRSP